MSAVPPPAIPRRDGRATLAWALSLGGAALVLYSTAVWGPVVGWDSLMYLGVVGSVVSDSKTSTLFAPLFPLILMGFAALGLSKIVAARYINSLLFGVLIGLSCLAGAKSGRGRWAFALSGCLALTSLVLLEQFSRVISEPLALCAGFGGLLAVAAYLEAQERSYLWLAAAAFAVAIATRYASGPFLAAGCIGILMKGDRAWSRRFADATVLGAAALLPLGGWLVRNAVVTGGALHREIVFHPPTAAVLSFAAGEISSWILPRRVPVEVRLLFLCVCVAAWIGLARASTPKESGARPNVLGRLLGLFCLCYAAFILLVSTFVDASVTAGTRHLLPIYVAALWALGLAVDRGLSAPSKAAMRRATAVGFGVFLLVSAAVTATKAYRLHRDGDGFGGRLIQTSVIRRLGEQRFRSRPVYAADTTMIRYVTGAIAFQFPSRYDPMTGARNPQFAAQLERVKGELRKSGGVTLRTVGGIEGPRYPLISELEEPLGLVVVAEDRFARIYGSAP